MGRHEWSTRLRANDCACFDIRTVTPDLRGWDRRVQPTFTLTYPDGRKVSADLTVSESPTLGGGTRFWFVCPACQRRCRKVYVTPAGDIGCRVCLRLVYVSQYPTRRTIDDWFRRAGF
jgi:hypothetical protein